MERKKKRKATKKRKARKTTKKRKKGHKKRTTPKWSAATRAAFKRDKRELIRKYNRK